MSVLPGCLSVRPWRCSPAASPHRSEAAGKKDTNHFNLLYVFLVTQDSEDGNEAFYEGNSMKLMCVYVSVCVLGFWGQYTHFDSYFLCSPEGNMEREARFSDAVKTETDQKNIQLHLLSGEG